MISIFILLQIIPSYFEHLINVVLILTSTISIYYLLFFTRIPSFIMILLSLFFISLFPTYIFSLNAYF